MIIKFIKDIINPYGKTKGFNKTKSFSNVIDFESCNLGGVKYGDEEYTLKDYGQARYSCEGDDAGYFYMNQFISISLSKGKVIRWAVNAEDLEGAIDYDFRYNGNDLSREEINSPDKFQKVFGESLSEERSGRDKSATLIHAFGEFKYEVIFVESGIYSIDSYPPGFDLPRI